MRTSLTRIALLAVAALSLAIGSGCTRIGPGHVGIVVNNAGSQRGVADYTPTTGWVFYMPGKTTVMEYPTFIQTAKWTASTHEGSDNDDSITFTTAQGIPVNVDVSFSYHLESDKVPSFYVQFRSDDLTSFTEGFLRNVARDELNRVGGTVPVETVMGNNGPFLQSVQDAIQKKVGQYGVVIDQFGLIGSPRPPKQIVDSINNKVEAEQIAMQKENEVKQAAADAQKAVATAQGYAQAHIAQAEGDAKATLINAEAQAQANQKLAASITDTLVRYEAVQKWNGTQPQVMGSGGLLFNIPVGAPTKK